MDYTVLLRYPTGMVDDEEEDVGTFYLATVVAKDLRHAIQEAQSEAMMAQPPEDRRGRRADEWMAILVLAGHHDMVYMRLGGDR